MLKNQYFQHWQNDLTESSKCSTYRLYKETQNFENYLLNVPTNLCRYLIKFRASNHKLPIERGRYTYIEQHRRYCDMCEQEELGDEFHLLFKCSNVNLVNRKKYLPNYYSKFPSMYKFCQLMSSISTNKILAINLAKFLKGSSVI